MSEIQTHNEYNNDNISYNPIYQTSNYSDYDYETESLFNFHLLLIKFEQLK